MGKICQRLAAVVIECSPESEVIRLQDGEDTLFFVDPPYLPSKHTKASYRHEMTEAEHVALLEQLKQVKNKVVLACYPSDLYEQQLKGWQRIERPQQALRSQKTRTEVFWLSPNAQK